MPSNTTRPFRGLTRPTTVLARVVLPEPVSPTRPTISPGQIFRFTPDSTWFARQPRPRTTSTRLQRASSGGRALASVGASGRVGLRGHRAASSASMRRRRQLGVVDADAARLVPGAEPGQRRSRPDRQASMAAGQRSANRQPVISRADLRRLAGDHLELAALEVADRGDPQQRLGVGMPGPLDDLLDRARLDHLARVEDDHPVAQLPDHGQVVGDEQHRQAALVAQVLEQLDDLRLDGDVEGGGGLVGDEQPRVAGDRDGDHDPLQHAAGQLGRDLVEDPLGIVQADRGEQLDRLAVRLARGSAAA